MAKYSTYLEISPNYESVVDSNSEVRHPNLWKDYIVHEDMIRAIEKIWGSLRNESPDARRSFWLHGAYGTGKTYAGLVIKHLLEDDTKDVAAFLSKPMLLEKRDSFLKLRGKGPYMVIWKSGCTDIRTGTQLMMELEISIRAKLQERFGEKAYLGKASLLSTVQARINDDTINWNAIYKDPAYAIYEIYPSLEHFRDAVAEGSLEACNTVAQVCREKGWALFARVEQFEEWIKDVISGNHLQDTGIFIIWDEFTGFLRQCEDDNILQRLSELCKQPQVPFFLCLIVHRDPGWLQSMGEETYARIMHRYHELEFHISESAAYELIGSSILVRPGYADQWHSIQDELMRSISKNMVDFDNLDQHSKQRDIRNLCPLHPMTLTMLATVAQNFGASQRTLFRFMKDAAEADQNVGFQYYINNYGPDDWRWLTPDFLWDYFFMRSSDIREYSKEARQAYQNYINMFDRVKSSEAALHIFKAASLLIAVTTSQSVSHLRSQAAVQRMTATKKTLYKYFAGKLNPTDVDEYLEALKDSGVIRLDPLPHGDARLELPFTGAADTFEIRLEKTRKDHSRYELFKKGSCFANAIEEKMWDRNRATFRRMLLMCCCSDTNSYRSRLGEMLKELEKYPYKIGLLSVAIRDGQESAALQSILKKIAVADETKRLIVALMKTPLRDETLEEWYRCQTNAQLAREDGKKGSGDQYEDEARLTLEKWAAEAAEASIVAWHGDIEYQNLFGFESLAGIATKDVIYTLFRAAPERVVTQNTAFAAASEKAALAGLTRNENKPSAQIANISNGLQAAKVWDKTSLDEIGACSDTPAASAVAALANFLRDTLQTGSRIKLEELWEKLQSPPFGYYNSLACAYLLGFCLRFYENSNFTWIREDKNPFALTQANMATMITLLCTGKTPNNLLSSGSDIWQQFKKYMQSLFALSPEDAEEEQKTRMNIRQKIITTGAPYWVLKYLPEDAFGGAEERRIAVEIISRVCIFVFGQGDIETVMDETLTLFKGHGALRQMLVKSYNDKGICYTALLRFMLKQEADLQALINSIGADPNELTDTLKRYMETAIYSWSEDEVNVALTDVAREFRMIEALNKALGVKKKSLEELRAILTNSFSNMKVPGAVAEGLHMTWCEALHIMNEFSEHGWGTEKPQTRDAWILTLKESGKKAWEYVNASKSLLRAYLTSINVPCEDAELDAIYGKLRPLPYHTPEASFRDLVQTQFDKIAYTREKAQLLKAWEDASGAKTVRDWCKHCQTPIQWVALAEYMPVINAIVALQDAKRIDSMELHNTLQMFSECDWKVLQDSAYIEKRFFDQIGFDMQPFFQENADTILANIRMELGADIYEWGTQGGKVRGIVAKAVREKAAAVADKTAKERIMKMPEAELRNKVVELLRSHPELYKLFVK